MRREINWQAPEMADAMLRLMTALEKQDIPFKGISITVDLPASPPRETYRGTFFGSVRVNEREV